MEQRDFIQRQIDQLGKVLGTILAQILALKTEGNIWEAEQTIESAWNDNLGVSLPEWLALEDAAVIEDLVKTKKYEVHHVQDLAEILLFAADNTTYNKEETYQKCLCLYEYVAQNSEEISLEVEWKIARLRQEVE